MVRHERLIVFEGVDGSGKTSLLAAVAKALAARGLSVATAKEPWLTLEGERVRRGWGSIADATSDRRQHWAGELERRLNRGLIVLCDRSYPSTVAVQVPDDPASRRREWDRQEGLFGAPGLFVHCHCLPETALARINARPDESTTLDACKALAHSYNTLPWSPLGVSTEHEMGISVGHVLLGMQQAGIIP